MLALVVTGVPRPLAAQETAAPPPGPEVVSLHFKGVHALSEDRLEGAIATHATHCKSPLFFLFCALGANWALERAYLDPGELPRDEERLRMLYESWGYPDAQVSSKVIPKGKDRVEVEFDIVEGPPVRVASLEIVGLDQLSPPVQLAGPPALKVGDVYALPMLEELQRQIVRAFAERGHPYARVEVAGSIDEVARTVALVLTVEMGPRVVFGEPVIVPGRPIGEEVVRERLAFHAGETFRPSALAETERALYELPIVERVIIEPIGLERGDTVVSPRIVVEPRKVSALQLEGTLSSTECLELATFWANRYFLGGPRLFSLGVGFSNLFANTFNEKFPCTSTGTGVYANPNYFVQANLRQPWPHHPSTQILVEGFFTRQAEAQAYVQRGYGGQFGIAHEYSPALLGTYLYSPKRRELKGASFYFCGDYGICDPAGLDEQTEFRWESPLDALTSWTPTGPPVTVRRAVEGERWRGWMRNGLTGSANATGSSYNYFRGIEEGAVTRLFGTRSELAARARVGVLMGQRILPPTTRLYSGGAYTVRGVSQNLLGPKLLSIAPEDVAAQGCTLAPDGCPPGTVADPDLVTVRATGGRAVTEANLEWRLWLGERLQLAMFADFGAIWRNFIHDDTREFGGTFSESLITPGIGVRILTGMGPIRVDVGYDPVGKRSYPLFVQETNGPVIFLGDVTYDPYTFGNPGWFTEFWRRLQFQVAIGQPF